MSLWYRLLPKLTAALWVANVVVIGAWLVLCYRWINAHF